MLRTITFLLLTSIASAISAQPVPGDCNGALRVGGRLDYQLIENVDSYQRNGLIKYKTQ